MAYTNHGEPQGSGDGTTTDAYASAATINCKSHKSKTMLLTNTDGANSLKYKLLAQVAAGGQWTELVAETTLAAAEDALFTYNNAYHALDLQVKAASAGNQATYAVEYTAMVNI